MLRGVLRPTAQTRDGSSLAMYEADRLRARKALIAWIEGIAAGDHKTKLNALAKQEGLTTRQLRRVLAKDDQLREELFGPLNHEAKLGVTHAVARGLEFLASEEPDPREVRQWGEFLAKLSGGSFEARAGTPGVVILQQLIPSLPPAARHIEARVLREEDHPTTTLDDLLGDKTIEEML